MPSAADTENMPAKRSIAYWKYHLAMARALNGRRDLTSGALSEALEMMSSTTGRNPENVLWSAELKTLKAAFQQLQFESNDRQFTEGGSELRNTYIANDSVTGRSSSDRLSFVPARAGD